TPSPADVSANGASDAAAGASTSVAGAYYWVASYSGDHDNKGAVSGCADEPVAIGQASPQISTTQLPAAGTVGDTFKDKATLAGLFGAHPGGTVSFKLFEIGRASCRQRATDCPVDVSANGDYEAPHGASPSAAGGYYWVASCSGDNDSYGAGCAGACEPVAIGQASPQISTTQLPAAGTVGDTFKDKATLAGLFGAHPGGTVSFKLF